MFRGIEKLQDDLGLRRDGILKPGGETEGTLRDMLVAANDTNNGLSNDTGEYQLAQMPIEAPPLGGGIGPAIGGAAAASGVIGYELLRRQQKNRDRQNMGIVDPFPLIPEPIDPPKFDNKTEFPAAPPEIPKLNGIPINEVMKNDPVIFQALRDDVIREFSRPLESHPGDETTQEGNRIIATDIIPKVIALWGAAHGAFQHLAGGIDKDGSRRSERYLPNRETQQRLGSSNADLTFGDGEETHHFNTGKTRKDGRTPIASEGRQLENLARNAGEDAAGFLPKLRPGMDRSEWYERTYKMAVEHFTKHWGPPLK
jgi:hypothetical protein